MIHNQHFRPYFNAIRDILDGILVINLDEIRQQCNASFLADKSSQELHVYTAEAVMISFTANAENEILKRKDS